MVFFVKRHIGKSSEKVLSCVFCFCERQLSSFSGALLGNGHLPFHQSQSVKIEPLNCLRFYNRDLNKYFEISISVLAENTSDGQHFCSRIGHFLFFNMLIGNIKRNRQYAL